MLSFDFNIKKDTANTLCLDNPLVYFNVTFLWTNRTKKKYMVCWFFLIGEGKSHFIIYQTSPSPHGRWFHFGPKLVDSFFSHLKLNFNFFNITKLFKYHVNAHSPSVVCQYYFSCFP